MAYSEFTLRVTSGHQENIHRQTAIGEPSSQVFSELREKYS
jgi:hypothetical protein